MKYILVLVTFAAMMVGCAHNAGDPTTPILPGDGQPEVAAAITQPFDSYDGPHRLWGEWIFFIDAEHERVDVVPRRQGRFHLNALKFLEEYCTDCLEITNQKGMTLVFNGISAINKILTKKMSKIIYDLEICKSENAGLKAEVIQLRKHPDKATDKIITTAHKINPFIKQEKKPGK